MGTTTKNNGRYIVCFEAENGETGKLTGRQTKIGAWDRAKDLHRRYGYKVWVLDQRTGQMLRVDAERTLTAGGGQ